MLLHEQLRQAREEAGLSQARLSELTGLSRNQIVRAESGENITLDTLRKIVVCLPLDELTLLERVKIKVDYLNPAEKMFFGIGETMAYMLQAMGTALKLAAAAKGVLVLARKAEAEAMGEEEQRLSPEADVLVDRIEKWMTTVQGMQDQLFGPPPPPPTPPTP